MNTFIKILGTGLATMALLSCGQEGSVVQGGDPYVDPGPTNEELLLKAPDFSLPQLAEPMLWGNYYGQDNGDSILEGTTDTTAQCIAYLDSIADLKEEREQSGDSLVDDKMGAPEYYYYDDYAWPNVVYTPVYQPITEFRASIDFYEEVELLNPGKIYMKDDYQFVGDINRGVHIYNKKDPENPKYIGFFYIPGNIDIAIKNNTLYANAYSTLIAIDITDPENPAVTEMLNAAFPDVYKYGQPVIDSLGGLAVAWKVDTTYECGNYWYDDVVYDMEMSGAASDTTAIRAPEANEAKDTFGEGGSMARFTVNSDYLYAVDSRELNMFNISNDMNPVDEGEVDVGAWDLETIFQVDTALFIGSMTGMYIFDIKDRSNPVFASMYQHVRSCDPVVVQDGMAYVTLSSGSRCWGGDNELDVIDVQDIYKPVELQSYEMLNPQGLAIEGDLLYVCEGDFGLRVMDATDPLRMETLSLVEGFHAYDVIADGSTITVIGNDGVYVFDATDPENLVELSHTEADGTGFGGNGGDFIVGMPEPALVDMEIAE